MLDKAFAVTCKTLGVVLPLSIVSFIVVLAFHSDFRTSFLDIFVLVYIKTVIWGAGAIVAIGLCVFLYKLGRWFWALPERNTAV